MNGLDLSQFSSQQLQALAQGDYSSLSNDQLQMLSQWHDQQTAAQSPQAAQQQFAQQNPMQSALAPAASVAGAGLGMAAAVPGAVTGFAKEHPLIAAGGAAMFGKEIKQGIDTFIKDPAMRAAQSVKDLALQGVRGGANAVKEGATRLGSISPEAMGMGSMADMAAAAAPYIKGASALGLMTYSPGLNNGEDQQLAQIRAQQAQMQPQQPNMQPVAPQPGMQ